MKFTVLILTGLISFSAIGNDKEINEAWEGFSSPDIFSSGFLHKMNALPLEGMIQVGPRAWSGDYWASKKGSINIRWNSPSKVGWDYYSPVLEDVKKMTANQLASLSPAEKYDLMMGHYDYPLKKEVAGNASKTAPIWAGICQGRALASLHHNEPTPKVVTNKDGIAVPFGSGDIKALLSYYYAFHGDQSVNQMGLRCYFGRWMGGMHGCDQDLNAGAFHITLSNMIGMKREGFIMDSDRFRQVWNAPVVGYKSVVLQDNITPGSFSAKKAVREMRVATELSYIEGSEPTWEPVMSTPEKYIKTKSLQYRLELDSEGNIVGGDWESDVRPDFIWQNNAADSFTGMMEGIPLLLND